MIQIPFTKGLDSFTEIVDIEEQSYVIGFSWNNREEAWYMSLFTLENIEIVTGIKLVLGMELLKRTGRPGIPPGEVYCVPMSPVDRINKTDIPDIVEIVYVTEAEV